MNLQKKEIVILAAVGALTLGSLKFLIPHIQNERTLAKQKAKAVTLNHSIPSFDNLLRFVQGDPGLGRDTLYPYLYYYEKVTSYFPNQAEAYALLGYCYYHLGRPKEAVTAYQNAVALNPVFFWPHYNLGVIYYEDGQYDKAIAVLQKAMASKPDIQLRIIFASKVYQQIISGHDLGRQLQMAILTGYRDGRNLMVLSYHRLKGEEPEPALQAAAKNMKVRIF